MGETRKGHADPLWPGLAFLGHVRLPHHLELGRTANLPGGPGKAILAGRHSNELLSQSGLEDDANYMIELVYWDFLADQLTATY